MMGDRWSGPRIPIRKGASFKGKEVKRKLGLSEVKLRLQGGQDLPASNYCLVKGPIRQQAQARQHSRSRGFRRQERRELAGEVERLLSAQEVEGKLSALDTVTQALDRSLHELREAAVNRLGVWDQSVRRLDSMQKQRGQMDRSIASLHDLISRQQSSQTSFQ